MIKRSYDSPEIPEFLKGRDYLLSNKYNWINGASQEISITSMVVGHQLNCINWLVICLDDLAKGSDELRSEMLPLVIAKMEDFKELFPLVVKREGEPLKSLCKDKYKVLKKEFKDKLHQL